MGVHSGFIPSGCAAAGLCGCVDAAAPEAPTGDGGAADDGKGTTDGKGLDGKKDTNDADTLSPDECYEQCVDKGEDEAECEAFCREGKDGKDGKDGSK